MATLGLHVGEGIAFGRELGAEVGVVLIEEVGLADAYPIELGLGGKLFGELAVEVVVDLPGTVVLALLPVELAEI